MLLFRNNDFKKAQNGRFETKVSAIGINHIISFHHYWKILFLLLIELLLYLLIRIVWIYIFFSRDM